MPRKISQTEYKQLWGQRGPTQPSLVNEKKEGFLWEVTFELTLQDILVFSVSPLALLSPPPPPVSPCVSLSLPEDVKGNSTCPGGIRKAQKGLKRKQWTCSY